MNIYLRAIQATSNKKEQLILLSELAKGTKFSEKYLNLLARSGKLEAHKEGRSQLSCTCSSDTQDFRNSLLGRTRGICILGRRRGV